MDPDKEDQAFWKVHATAKRKLAEKQTEVLSRKKQKDKGRRKGVEGMSAAGKQSDDTDKELFQLLHTMNQNLDVIRQHQLLIAERIGHVEGEMRGTYDVFENRLRRLEGVNDQKRDYNDQQHDYNDRISRVLEILVGRDGKKTCSQTENRDREVGVDRDVGNTAEGNLVRKALFHLP